MTERESDPVSRLAKLNKADDYILWKRRVFAYIRRFDAELVGFQMEPSSNATAVRKKWFESVMKAKSTIILCLGDSPLSKVRRLIDDDNVTAKELWDELEKIYTSSNAQSILNLRQELDNLRFEEGKSWDSHVNKFMNLLSKLATYDEELNEKEKASKLLRSLPESFGGFAMIAQLQDLELEKLIQGMQAEISRRLNSSGSSTRVEDVPKAASASKGKQGKKGSNFSGRIQKGTDECYVCGRTNHFARDCWYKAGGSNNRGRGHDSYRGGRGRGIRGGFSGRGNRGGRGWRGNRRRGRGGFHSSQYFSPSFNNGSNGAHPTWRNGKSSSVQHVMPFDQQQQQHPQANYQQLGGQENHQASDLSYQFQGFMAKIKRSSLTSVNTVKTDDALIDSGATHFFFHSIKYFKNYRRIEEENVQSASGVSRIVGIGTVFIPIGNGMHFEAYHAPEFGENILSVSKMSRFFTIQFSTDGFGDQSTCNISSKTTGKLIFKTLETDGLYKISVPKIHKSSDHPRYSLTSNMSNSENLDCTVCASSAALPNGTYRRTSVLHENKPLQWHFRTGHPSPTRYSQLSECFSDVPFFPRNILNDMFCVPCQQGKTKRAAVLPTQTKANMPLELVHLDISGPVLPSLSGSIYALSIMDSVTAKSDVLFLKKKSELATGLMKYKASSELHTGCRLRKMRLDGAGENMGGAVETFCTQHGILLDPSPPYAHQSNGTAERLIQELWARTRVLLFASKLPASLWAEAMNHSNWLRNRLPSSRIQDQIPILLWDPSTTVQFSKIPVFGQPGFAFKYRSETVPNKKFLARSVHGHFVGMGSDKTIIRVYVPESKSVMLTRIQDFRQYSDEKLPGVASIIDGISRQAELEGIGNSNGQAGNFLLKALQVFHTSTNPLPSHRDTCSAYGLLRSSKANSHLPFSFKNAILDPNWRAAIDREYSALRARGTWEYVKRTPDMKPVPFTWVFRLKPLDNNGKSFLHKARCVIRGDKQTAYFDFDPNNIYAPVVCHEAIRILLAYAAAYNLQMEGADISNAYLYGKLDVPIFMMQPTNSTGIPERPGMVCRLLKSLYGLRQAGEIWGSLLCQTLLSWGFKVSNVDKRMFFLVTGSQFIILVVVVDDMKFVSNSTALMSRLKQKLAATFDVKLFGKLQAFIGWEIRYSPNGIKVTQTRYAKDLISRCGMQNCNAAWSPLPTTADLTSFHDGDVLLNSAAHSEYRSLIGALIHLAVSTRPDILFGVGALARHVHNPTIRHRALLKRILRYIAGTTEYGLQYTQQQPITAASLSAHVDADWGGCMDSRHSTTGYIVTVNGGPISWKIQKQTVIALSSAESEYVAMSSCAKEVTWLRRIMWEIHAKRPFDATDESCMPPTPVHSDSTAAIALAKNDTVAARNKHIEIKVHHLKDLWKRGIIKLLHVPSLKNIADLLTKIVAFRILRALTQLLRM